jgi:hypothetical protein
VTTLADIYAAIKSEAAAGAESFGRGFGEFISGDLPPGPAFDQQAQLYDAERSGPIGSSLADMALGGMQAGFSPYEGTAKATFDQSVAEKLMAEDPDLSREEAMGRAEMLRIAGEAGLGVMMPLMSGFRGLKTLRKMDNALVNVENYARSPYYKMKGGVGYHGTPHKWAPEPGAPLGRPRLEHVGKGEGAQAYGHGFYVAESPDVAGTYQRVLGAGGWNTDSSPVFKDIPEKIRNALPEYSLAQLRIAWAEGGEEYAKNKLRKMIDKKRTDAGFYKKNGYDLESIQARHEADAMIDLDRVAKWGETSGYKYKLDIPDEVIDNMLDWDAPLSEQPERVRNAMQKAFEKAGIPKAMNMKPNGDSARAWIESAVGPDMSAQIFDEVGIPGIKYYDQVSRQGQNGTRNFVLFNPERDVKVLGRE